MPYNRQYYQNNAVGQLAVPLGTGPTANTVTLQTGQGALFGSDVPLVCTIYTLNSVGDRDIQEVVRVTGISGDVLTVDRAIENIPQTATATTPTATPQPFDTGSFIEVVNSAGQIEEINRQIAVDDDTTDIVHKTGDETIDGSKTFDADDFQGYDEDVTGKAAFTDFSFATKGYVLSQTATASPAFLFGDGSDGDLVIASGTTAINPAQIYNFSNISISAGASLINSGISGNNARYVKARVTYIKCKGTLTLDGSIDLSGSFAGFLTGDPESQFIREVGTDVTLSASGGTSGSGGRGGDGGYSSTPKPSGFGGSGTLAGGGGGGNAQADFLFKGGNGSTSASTTFLPTGGASVSISSTSTGVAGNDGDFGGGGSGAVASQSNGAGTVTSGAGGGGSYGDNGGDAISTDSGFVGGGGGGAAGEPGKNGSGLQLYANILAGSGIIDLSGSNGGVGGRGGNANDISGFAGAGGGGGGGGGGTFGGLILVYGSGTYSYTLKQNNGTGGLGGNQGVNDGSGTQATAGGDGTDGMGTGNIDTTRRIINLNTDIMS